jgi:hypothetical protein
MSKDEARRHEISLDFHFCSGKFLRIDLLRGHEGYLCPMPGPR